MYIWSYNQSFWQTNKFDANVFYVVKKFKKIIFVGVYKKKHNRNKILSVKKDLKLIINLNLIIVILLP